MPPGEEREARRVPPDLLHQLLHQHELAPPLGHAHRLAVAQQGHELDDEHVEGLRRVPEGLHRGAQAEDVAVVVGAEEVDHVPARPNFPKWWKPMSTAK